MNNVTPSSDSPQGWDQYSRILHALGQRPLPEGYHARFQGKLAALENGTRRRTGSWEWIGGASLAVFAAIFVLAINAVLPSSPPTLQTSAVESTAKARAKHLRTVRRQTPRRQQAPELEYTTPIITDTMPPATLDQDYQDPAVTGVPAKPEDQMQHDAQPGVPAMTR